MTVQEFADKHRVKTRVDSCGETIIPGKPRKTRHVEDRCHIFEFEDGVFGLATSSLCRIRRRSGNITTRRSACWPPGSRSDRMATTRGFSASTRRTLTWQSWRSPRAGSSGSGITARSRSRPSAPWPQISIRHVNRGRKRPKNRDLGRRMRKSTPSPPNAETPRARGVGGLCHESWVAEAEQEGEGDEYVDHFNTTQRRGAHLREAPSPHCKR